MNGLVCGQLPRVSRACAVNVCQYIILAIEKVKTVKRVEPLESVRIILVALCTCIVLIMRYESFATRKKNN